MSLAVLGAEPATPARPGPIGVLVLHGFTATPETVAPLAAAASGSGREVLVPLLPGHGRAPGALGATRYRDWLGAARAALASLRSRCGRLVVVGHSMGGTLALELAASEADICGVVVVNPLIEPPAGSVFQILSAALASGVETVAFAGRDVRRTDVAYTGATEAPIAAVVSLLAATGPLSGRLGEITAPVLVFSSRVDHVVPPSSGGFLCARLAAPHERIVLEESFHLAPIDHDGPFIAARLSEFVSGLEAAAR